MHFKKPDGESDPKRIGEIYQDEDDPTFVFIVTAYRSWRVNGYMLQTILNNHFAGVNTDEVDAPNPFVQETGEEEDWERRKRTKPRFFKDHT